MASNGKSATRRKRKAARLIRFGVRVRTMRKEAGFTQETFAFACGLDPNYIGGIERGERNVAILNLYKIASALKISISELFDFPDPSA